MELNSIVSTDKTYVMGTYNRRRVSFVSGKGSTLVDTNGKEYLDFMAGIAVNNIGYSHPVFLERVKNQLDHILHSSNLYYIEPQALLAKKICESTCADKVFFSNSGAEANEGAIKLAKLHFYKQGKANKNEIITLVNSFHGRTLATLAATGQPKYQKPYQPTVPGFSHVPINDREALKHAVSSNTAAIMLELVQGESGVYPTSPAYVTWLRQFCDENEILLIFDEVQTGMGRTGTLMAHQQYGIEPDIFTLAKALGGGVPIGAVCAKAPYAAVFEFGDHGSTFGGNFLAATAGLAVFEIMENEGLPEKAKSTGAYFKKKLGELAEKKDTVKEARGLGLMLGLELNDEIAAQAAETLFEKGFIVGVIAGKILRFLPPLVVTEQEIDKLIACLDEIL